MNRTIAPAYSQPNSLAIQFPKEIKLSNGARLFLIEDVKDDSVKIDIEWNAGSKYQDKKLVANFTNKLLLSGNERQSSGSIAEEIDYFGGYLQHEVDRDHAGITLYGLTENIEDIFSLISQAFRSTAFPEKEFEKERTVGLMQFRIEGKKGKNICRRSFNKAIFGPDSEYGQLAEEIDFESIQREDLLDFYNAFYLNGVPTIFVVGKIEQSLIDKMNDWTAKTKPQKKEFTPKKVKQIKGRIDEPFEDAIQSAIRFGRIMFDKNHADYFKFQLLNTLLGGYFGSRLMANIREDKGYTYGIGSAMSVMENAAYFFISTEVGVDVREKAIQEIYHELNRLKTELIPADELLKVKNYMLGDFLRHADGPIAMMENFKNIHFNKLKQTYYTDFIQAVNNATAEELQELAQRYFREEDLTIVTAG